jgi:small subunit ribosomal protein S5
MRAETKKKEERKSESFAGNERVISINRCAKVVKGGRNFSFSALVVVGNRNGRVGAGLGKANEVSDAIRKAGDNARKNMITVPINDTTIPHSVEAKFGAGRIILKPASKGTGIIAGGGMRAVLELAGVKDVLGKSLGSANQVNVVKATMEAIKMMKSKDEILSARGKIKKAKMEDSQ